MKHRRLNIFFITVMAVVATPQAWRQFHDFAASAQHQAGAAWWRVLLSVNMRGTEEEEAPLACQQLTDSHSELAVNRGGPVQRKSLRAAGTSASRRARSAQSLPAPNLDAARYELISANFLTNSEWNPAYLQRKVETQRDVVLKNAPRVELAAKLFNDPTEVGEIEGLLQFGKYQEKNEAMHASMGGPVSLTMNSVPVTPVPLRAPDMSMIGVREPTALPLVDALPEYLDEQDMSLHFKTKKVVEGKKLLCSKLRIVSKSAPVIPLTNINHSASISGIGLSDASSASVSTLASKCSSPGKASL